MAMCAWMINGLMGNSICTLKIPQTVGTTALGHLVYGFRVAIFHRHLEDLQNCKKCVV